jgi:hypothetical protein
MARKRYTPEEIVAKLNVLVSQGQNAIRQIGVSEVTYYRWAGEAPEGPWAGEQPAAQGGFRFGAGQTHCPRVEPARQYGRYGYCKVAELLRQAGWIINDKRVERIWQREELKVPHKQPKRGRLWLADGSCIRLRPEHRNYVWSYDFVEDRTHDGRSQDKQFDRTSISRTGYERGAAPLDVGRSWHRQPRSIAAPPCDELRSVVDGLELASASIGCSTCSTS